MPRFSAKYPNQSHVQMTCANGRPFHRAFNLGRHLVNFLAPPPPRVRRLISFLERISDPSARHREHQVAIGVNGDFIISVVRPRRSWKASTACSHGQARTVPGRNAAAGRAVHRPSNQSGYGVRPRRTPGPCVAVYTPWLEADPLVAPGVIKPN
jgi:hypothetical protein